MGRDEMRSMFLELKIFPSRSVLSMDPAKLVCSTLESLAIPLCESSTVDDYRSIRLWLCDGLRHRAS
jgi:hypothetical protein